MAAFGSDYVNEMSRRARGTWPEIERVAIMASEVLVYGYKVQMDCLRTYYIGGAVSDAIYAFTQALETLHRFPDDPNLWFYLKRGLQ